MRELSRYRLLCGRDEPAVDTRELRVEPLVCRLEGIDLRYLAFGDVELVRRLFVAIRDDAWGTVPPVVGGLEVEERDDSFRISFEAVNEAGDLCFRWRGELAGSRDGTLDCRLDGAADSDCRFNRIGFCVLHPREHAGRRYRALTPDGKIEGRLPDTIGRQLIVDGLPSPLFPSFDRLEVEVADGLWARFEFEGDLFEMEDQRNWTDASFKTYSTPLRLGFPHQARAGQKIRQHIRLSVSGERPRPTRRPRGAVTVVLGEDLGVTLPALGLGMASHGGDLSEREAGLLRALRLGSLRADLRLDGEDCQAELERAVDATKAVGARLELALHLGDEPEEELDALADRLGEHGGLVERALVFTADAVTPAQWVRLARERLARALPAAAFGGGTDGWFVDLNRDRPDLVGLDAVAYSINATVHADDDTSVLETPAAQGDTVRSARAFCGDVPIAVGPVTLRPRAWPFGELAPGLGGLPFQVDLRQPSLFAAAWTAASLKHLAEGGASSVSYFETTGWRGVVEREEGPALDVFPSWPGMTFPLYHVLADAGEWKGGRLVAASSGEPLAVEALAVRVDGRLRVLVARLSPRAGRCELGPLPAGRATVRVLDESTAESAASDPEAFRAESEEREVSDGRLELELAPYSVVRVDA